VGLTDCLFTRTYKGNIYLCGKIQTMIIKGVLQDFQEFFKHPKKVSIVIHTNPDGDALGSGLALQGILNKLGHQSKLLIPNMYPSFLSWMPGLEEALIFEGQHKELRSFLYESDWVCCLDFNSLKRAGTMQEDLLKATSDRMMVDHHIQPDMDNFSLIYHHLDVSSTAELVYQLLAETANTHLIDTTIASALYVGIMTDTGSFSFALKNRQTFQIVAKLMQYDIDAERLHRMVYDTFTEDRLRLLGHSISNCMTVLDDYKTAIISLSLKDLKKFRYKIGDTEGLVNYPLSMEKINLSILITERKDQIRLSFRSKGSFSVNSFANRHFGGGGHPNAAGATSNLSLQETIKKIMEVIPMHKDELSYTY